MNGQYEGRLELTWTNKHRSLLAHEDGTYEWLPQSDFRVAEVRLLHDVDVVGNLSGDSKRAADNLLTRGDALYGLTSLANLPEFAQEYVGKVKLAYLDPPFNTQQAFVQYDDALEHSVWLTMIDSSKLRSFLRRTDQCGCILTITRWPIAARSLMRCLAATSS